MSKCEHDWNMSEIGIWHCWKCKQSILARKPDDYGELEKENEELKEELKLRKLYVEKTDTTLMSFDSWKEKRLPYLRSKNNEKQSRA